MCGIIWSRVRGLYPNGRAPKRFRQCGRIWHFMSQCSPLESLKRIPNPSGTTLGKPDTLDVAAVARRRGRGLGMKQGIKRILLGSRQAKYENDPPPFSIYSFANKWLRHMLRLSVLKCGACMFSLVGGA